MTSFPAPEEESRTEADTFASSGVPESSESGMQTESSSEPDLRRPHGRSEETSFHAAGEPSVRSFQRAAAMAIPLKRLGTAWKVRLRALFPDGSTSTFVEGVNSGKKMLPASGSGLSL